MVSEMIIIFFLLVSCSQSLKKDDHINLNFSQDLSFKNFKLQSICSRYLISNEVNLINCVEDNKYSNFDNAYYLKIWSINNNISEFCKAVQKLSISFKYLKLNTDISFIINNKVTPDKENYKNITIH